MLGFASTPGGPSGKDVVPDVEVLPPDDDVVDGELVVVTFPDVEPPPVVVHPPELGFGSAGMYGASGIVTFPGASVSGAP